MESSLVAFMIGVLQIAAGKRSYGDAFDENAESAPGEAEPRVKSAVYTTTGCKRRKLKPWVDLSDRQQRARIAAIRGSIINCLARPDEIKVVIPRLFNTGTWLDVVQTSLPKVVARFHEQHEAEFRANLLSSNCAEQFIIIFFIPGFYFNIFPRSQSQMLYVVILHVKGSEK